jgi:hypothetical protein
VFPFTEKPSSHTTDLNETFPRLPYLETSPASPHPYPPSNQSSCIQKSASDALSLLSSDIIILCAFPGPRRRALASTPFSSAFLTVRQTRPRWPPCSRNPVAMPSRSRIKPNQLSRNEADSMVSLPAKRECACCEGLKTCGEAQIAVLVNHDCDETASRPTLISQGRIQCVFKSHYAILQVLETHPSVWHCAVAQLSLES